MFFLLSSPQVMQLPLPLDWPFASTEDEPYLESTEDHGSFTMQDSVIKQLSDYNQRNLSMGLGSHTACQSYSLCL